MCLIGYLKILDVNSSLVSSQKIDWTRTFDAYCILSQMYDFLGKSTLIILLYQCSYFYS